MKLITKSPIFLICVILSVTAYIISEINPNEPASLYAAHKSNEYFYTKHIQNTSPDITYTEIVSDTYQGVEVGFTQEGWAYRGSSDAPVIMYKFSDFACPFCERYVIQTEPTIYENYIETGTVKLVFRDMPLAQLHPTVHIAHEANLCAGDQGSLAYWQMHDQIATTVSQWRNDPQPFMIELADALGFDMGKFSPCLENSEKSSLIEASLAEAQSLGLIGVPTFILVNQETGYEHQIIGARPYDIFASALDTLIAGEQPVSDEPSDEDTGGGEIPFWVTAEGLAPDPDRPGYTMAGDQYRGDVNAPIAVIEFCSLQGPFCQRHHRDTQPILDEQFVEQGQILWMFKHFPLDIHPQSPAAGIAAECASEQGKFWEMHDLLYETISSWSHEEPNSSFITLAAQLELDESLFESCLDDDEMAERVQSDLQDGASFVRGTPSFVVVNGEQGSLIPGALPVERFQEVLEEVLEAVVPTPTPIPPNTPTSLAETGEPSQSVLFLPLIHQ